MLLGSRRENHLDAELKEAILLKELRQDDLHTSHTKVKWVKKLGLLTSEGEMRLPIKLYSSNLN